MLIAVSLRAFASGKPSLRMNLAKSSVKVESPLRVRRGRAWKCNTPTIIYRQTNSDRLLGYSLWAMPGVAMTIRL